MTLAEALEAVENDGTVTLIADAKLSATYAVFKNITIDLNGYSYTIGYAPVGSAGTETLGFQILRDNTVTIRNGVIAADVESIEANNEKTLKMLIQNYANLLKMRIFNVIIKALEIKRRKLKGEQYENFELWLSKSG